MAEPARTTLKLSLPDQISSVKRTLENVLAEFDVNYEWSKQTSHVLSVEIWVNNKRLSHTYTHIDYRANFDARTDLRRKLMSVHAPLKKVPLPRTVDPELLGGVPLSVAVAADRPRPVDQIRAGLLSSVAMIDAASPGTKPQFQPRTEPPEISAVSERAATPPEVSAAPEEIITPDPSPPAVLPDPPVATPVTIDGRTLYQSVLLAPAEVLVIEIHNDLLIPKGDVLVIPLHDTNLHLHMPKAQFLALFRQSEKAPPEPEVTPPPVAEPVVAEPVIGKPVEPVIAEPVMPETPVTVEQSKPAPAPPAVKKPVARRPPEVPPADTIDLEVRSVEGITAQVARHMNAIAYMQNVTQQPSVAVRDLTGLLDTRDHKQVSARMPVATKLGFARRFESRDGKPLQYGLTAAGHQLIARMQTWPWLREGLPVPDWAAYN